MLRSNWRTARAGDRTGPVQSFELSATCTDRGSCATELQATFTRCAGAACAITFTPPRGLFRFEHQGFLELRNVLGVRLNGHGAIVVHHGNASFIRAVNCSNIALAGFEVHTTRPPHTLGTVVGPTCLRPPGSPNPETPATDFDRHPSHTAPSGPCNLTLRFDESLYPFPEADHSWLLRAEALLEWDSQAWLPTENGLDWINASNADGPNKDSDVPGIPITLLSDGVISLPDPGFGLAVGATVVLRHYAFGPWHSLLLEDCTNVSVEDVTLARGGGMGLLAIGCTDVSLARFGTNRGLTSPLDPVGARYPLATNADAIHLASCRGTVAVVDCFADGQGDDSLNVHSQYLLLRNASANCGDVNGSRCLMDLEGTSDSASLWDSPLHLRGGDHFILRDAETLGIKAEGVVTEVAPLVPKGTASPPRIRVTCSLLRGQGASFGSGDPFVDLSASPASVRVEGARFVNSRSSGAVLNCRNATVLRSHFANLSAAAFNIGSYWGAFSEAPLAANFSLGFNVVDWVAKGHRTITGGSWGGGSAIQITPGRSQRAGQVFSDISVQNSNFSLLVGDAAVSATAVDRLTVQGCVFAARVKPSQPVRITDSTGVSAQDNKCCLLQNGGVVSGCGQCAE